MPCIKKTVLGDTLHCINCLSCRINISKQGVNILQVPDKKSVSEIINKEKLHKTTEVVYCVSFNFNLLKPPVNGKASCPAIESD